MTADEMLVEILRANPEQRARLLREHKADAAGRCPKCSSGGDSSARVLSPCTLLRAAQVASGKLKK